MLSYIKAISDPHNESLYYMQIISKSLQGIQGPINKRNMRCP